MRKEHQSSYQIYYPIHYGHPQALLPGPPPTYSYEPLAMYHPMQNQWRQNQSQQSNVQSAQPETSVANNNPQNNQAKQENNSPSVSAVNNNAIILSRGRILTITGENSMDHENNSQRRNYFRRVNSILMEGPYKKSRRSNLPIIFSQENL